MEINLTNFSFYFSVDIFLVSNNSFPSKNFSFMISVWFMGQVVWKIGAKIYSEKNWKAKFLIAKIMKKMTIKTSKIDRVFDSNIKKYKKMTVKNFKIVLGFAAENKKNILNR